MFKTTTVTLRGAFMAHQSVRDRAIDDAVNNMAQQIKRAKRVSEVTELSRQVDVSLYNGDAILVITSQFDVKA